MAPKRALLKPLGEMTPLVQSRRKAVGLALQSVAKWALELVLGAESGKALELRRSKGVWRAGLERASEEQLRRQQRGEVHIKRGARSEHVGLRSLSHAGGIDVWNVASLGMPVRVAAGGWLTRME